MKLFPDFDISHKFTLVLYNKTTHMTMRLDIAYGYNNDGC
jgi:hypothetical protein